MFPGTNGWEVTKGWAPTFRLANWVLKFGPPAGCVTGGLLWSEDLDITNHSTRGSLGRISLTTVNYLTYKGLHSTGTVVRTTKTNFTIYLASSRTACVPCDGISCPNPLTLCLFPYTVTLAPPISRESQVIVTCSVALAAALALSLSRVTVSLCDAMMNFGLFSSPRNLLSAIATLL